jgi:hypothetical protein
VWGVWCLTLARLPLKKIATLVDKDSLHNRMELAFTKLFNKIVTSSVWSEDDKTRIMWITMLALSDRNGYVAAALPGLADVSRMSLQDAKNAIKKLESPDPYSRSKVSDGKRIIPVNGGWEIVTYDIHRKLLSQQERLEYKAAWIRKRRQKCRQMSTKVEKVSTSVTQAEAEAETTSTKVDVVNSDEDFVSELSKDGTYEGIDVRREFGKMANWCKVHHTKPTRRRFVNWLNRAEKSMKVSDKEPAPTGEAYRYIGQPREITEEEREKSQKVAREEIAKFKQKFKIP